jgi:predicted transcriptional regulator of viral defense system
MKKEDITYLANLLEKLKRTNDLLNLHRTNDTEAMFKQYQAISNDTLFEIMQILYQSGNRNHELANKISFNLFIKYPNNSVNKMISDDDMMPNLEMMLG